MKKPLRSAANILLALSAAFLLMGASGLCLVIPAGTTVIENNAYQNRILYSGVEIPDSVTEIGRFAFYGCTGLTEVTIPESVTKIGDNAFMNCTGLTKITIPDSVTEIGRHIFRCTSLVWGDISQFCMPDQDAGNSVSSRTESLTGSRLVPLNMYPDQSYCLSELYFLLPASVRTQDCEEAEYALVRRVQSIPRMDYTGPANDTVTELWLCGKDGTCVLLCSILREPPTSGSVPYGLSLDGPQANAAELWEEIRDLFD